MRARPAWLLHAIWVTSLAAMAAVVVGAIMLPIEKVVRSAGQVRTVDPVSPIVAPVSGRIRSMHVVDGQIIARGQPLVTIEPDVNGLSIAQAAARRFRAAAELAAYTGQTFPELSEASLDLSNEALAISKRVTADRDAMQAEALAFERQWEEAAANLAVECSALERLEALEPAMLERLRSGEQLVKDGFQSPIAVLAIRQEAIDASRQISIAEARVERASKEMVRRHAAWKAQRAEASRLEAQRAAAARSELQEARFDLEKLTDLSEISIVRSPVSGAVEQVSDQLAGNAVRAGERLLSVIPDASRFELSLLVRNEDFPFVRVGQAVEVKFDAFPYTVYGTRKAVVKATSNDVLISEPRGAHYRVIASIDFGALAFGEAAVPLKPGMKVSADIAVGLQRPIDIWLDPFLRFQMEALREVR